jgi:hypothetical protein
LKIFQRVPCALPMPIDSIEPTEPAGRILIWRAVESASCNRSSAMSSAESESGEKLKFAGKYTIASSGKRETSSDVCGERFNISIANPLAYLAERSLS